MAVKRPRPRAGRDVGAESLRSISICVVAAAIKGATTRLQVASVLRFVR
jgi:hypothetical protein